MNGSAVKIEFKFDPKSMRDVHDMLSQIPDKMRSKVLRGALRRVLTQQMRATKAAARPQDVRTRRDIAIKTKTYKRGKVIWASVGVLWDIGGGRRDSVRQGWRAHFHDVGYRPWKKGLKPFLTAKEPQPDGRRGRNPNPRFAPFIKFNKGWRKGKRRYGLGGRILRTKYLSNPAEAFEPIVQKAVVKEVQATITEANGGK